MQKLKKFLERNKIIGIDTMIFVYLFEDNRKYANLSEFIFERIEKGFNTGVVSNLSLFEILAGVYKSSLKKTSRDYIRFFLETPNLKIIPPNIAILDIAAQMRAEYNTKSIDTICYITSVIYGANAFITNDIDLLKIKKPPINILYFNDFLKI